jgi:ribonuclease E
MKRVALLLAGLTLGMTSPALAGVWVHGGFETVAEKGLQLAQNDDRRDKRAKPERQERSEPRDQRGSRDGRGQREPVPQREGPPQREPAPQREAPQRDPRESYEARQGGYRDPREANGRPDPREAPQAYARPRLSAQSAIGAISRRFPGGRLLDSQTVTRNGRTYYSVRYLTRGGDRVDNLVDAETGAILPGGG